MMHAPHDDRATDAPVSSTPSTDPAREAEPRPEGGFDPLSDLLVAQKARPAHLARVNLRTLTPFQRALLVIDGTVTKFIEAYTMEPVEVVRLAQETHALAADHAMTDAPRGTSVIARQVLLQGCYNRTLYAYAASLLVRDRLPADVRADLDRNPGGLGRILLDHRLETRREVLWFGREHVRPPLPEPVRPLAEGKFISRAYRIMAAGRPLMMINEKFPLEGGPPAHH